MLCLAHGGGGGVVCNGGVGGEGSIRECGRKLFVGHDGDIRGQARQLLGWVEGLRRGRVLGVSDGWGRQLRGGRELGGGEVRLAY